MSIKSFFSKIFRFKRNNSLIWWRNSKKVLFKMPKKSFFKKRSTVKIKFDFKKPLRFFKRNYIPYYLITWLILIASIIFIVLWPIFRVENINIIRKDWITDINIAYKAVDDFRWVSIFNIDKTEILERMKDYQENIKDITLDLEFPKTINILVESYKERFNVNINWKNYILLENGSLIATAEPSKDLETLEIIKNIDKTRILEYKIVFDMEYIQKIEEIERMVKENIAWINITSLKYYEKERELHIIVNDFSRLIFSLDNSITSEEQIKSLAVLDRENSQISNNDKIYIDLRIKWKVFFCSIAWDKDKKIENQCRANLKYIYNQL